MNMYSTYHEWNFLHEFDFQFVPTPVREMISMIIYDDDNSHDGDR